MTAVETQHHLIAPHGGYLVDRTGPRPDNVDSLEQVPLTSRELSDLDMLASGALSPLEGFLGRDDYDRVLEEMRLAKGLAWSLPLCLAVDREPAGDQVALTDEAGEPAPPPPGRRGLRDRKGRRGRCGFPPTPRGRPPL